VHTENPVVYEGSHWEMIEEINEGFPKLRIITTFALIPKAVYFRDVLTFVITPKQVNSIRILYFVGE
jgi:hypothetical protein